MNKNAKKPSDCKFEADGMIYAFTGPLVSLKLDAKGNPSKAGKRTVVTAEAACQSPAVLAHLVKTGSGLIFEVGPAPKPSAPKQAKAPKAKKAKAKKSKAVDQSVSEPSTDQTGSTPVDLNELYEDVTIPKMKEALEAASVEFDGSKRLRAYYLPLYHQLKAGGE